MKKIIKQKLEAVTKLILVVAIFVTSFGYIPFVSAQDYTKGEIIDLSNSKTADGVTLEKTISATDEEGVYTVTLNVTGEEKTQSQTAPIYAVVVFDRSGSMENYYCDLGSAIFNGCSWGDYIKKWDNAVSGAKDFADSLLTAYPSSQIALVTFSDSAISSPFANSNLDNANFGSPYGGTALSSGIKAANNLLATAPKASNKYIIIISDGEPNYGDSYSKEAETAIKNGYEIFAIGYEDEGNALKQIVSKPSTTHYSDGNAFNISDVFSDMVGNIKIPAGKDATITDVIADGFTYVEGSASADAIVNGKNISFYIGDITSAGTTVSFKIKTDKDLADGLHRTNDLAKVEYNENAKLEITDSSKIYWEQDKYTYTVNYKEQDTENLLSESKVVTDAVYGRSYSENALDITGYNVVGDATKAILIDDDNKEITFYYTKKNDLTYTVEYYLDNLNNKLGLEGFDNQTFGDTIEANEIDVNKHLEFGYQDGVIITTMPYTIIDGENIIQVLYQKREDMTYSVNYLDKDTNESILDSEIRNDKKYLETYTEVALEITGYNVVGESTQEVLVDKDNKEITFYYTKREDMKYTVNYKEQDTEKVLADSKVVNDAVYNETYAETAKKITGYNVVGSTKQEVLVDEDNKEITFYYTKREDMKYTVNYKEQDTEKVLADSKVVNDAVYNETYAETAKEITGYNVVGNATQNVLISEDNQEITFYYTKKTDLTYIVEYYLDNLSNKLGFEKFDNQTFGYTVEANEIDVNKYLESGYQDGVFITDMPYTIIDGENIIQVLYQKREDMTYSVNYLDKDTNESIIESEIKTDKRYLETYIETAKEAPFGYRLVSDETQEVLVNEDNKLVTFYYEKRDDMKYTVNYKEEGTDKVLSESKVVADAVYNETYTEVALEITGYNVVGESIQEVLVDEDNKEITFYYTKKNDLSYIVEYYLDGTKISNDLDNTFDGKTFEEVINSEDIDINKYLKKGYKDGVFITEMPYTITDGENIIQISYTKKDDLTYRVEYYYDGVLDKSKTDYFENLTYGTEISEYEDKNIEGYIFVKDTGVLVIDDEIDNVIKVYYEQENPGIGSGCEDDIQPPNTGVDTTSPLYLLFLLPVALFISFRRSTKLEK